MPQNREKRLAICRLRKHLKEQLDITRGLSVVVMESALMKCARNFWARCSVAEQAALVVGTVPDWIGAEECVESWAALLRGDNLLGLAAGAPPDPQLKPRRAVNIGCDEFARVYKERIHEARRKLAACDKFKAWTSKQLLDKARWQVWKRQHPDVQAEFIQLGLARMKGRQRDGKTGSFSVLSMILHPLLCC